MTEKDLDKLAARGIVAMVAMHAMILANSGKPFSEAVIARRAFSIADRMIEGSEMFGDFEPPEAA